MHTQTEANKIISENISVINVALDHLQEARMNTEEIIDIGHTLKLFEQFLKEEIGEEKVIEYIEKFKEWSAGR